MENKVVQLNRIKNSHKVIYLFLFFTISFNLYSKAQVHKVDSIPIVDLGPDGYICDSTPQLLNAYNVGCTYEWKFNNFIVGDSSFMWVNQAGVYSVKVTSIDSTSAFDTIKFKAATKPDFYIFPNIINRYDSTVSFAVGNIQFGYLYQWNFGDPTSNSNVSALANPIHKFENLDAWITLTLIDVRTNCSNTDSFKLESWMFFWGIDNSYKDFYEVSAFPNPTTSESKLLFTIKNPTSIVTLKAYDLLGREQFVFFENEKLFQGENSVEFYSYFQKSESTISFLKLTIDDNIITTKIINLR